jgi:hypothetical protein
MENSVLWHYRSARGEEFDAALHELDRGRDDAPTAATEFQPPEGADA